MHKMVFDRYGDPDVMKTREITYLSGSGMYMAVQRMLRSLNSQRRGLQLSELGIAQQALAFLLALVLLLAACSQSLVAQAPPGPPEVPSGPPYTQQTPEELEQLVAPIALYPDSLVAQILAASTFPEQVVDADRWVQSHRDLNGEALAQAVDQMPWDPSVKALIAFPSVLGNMDKNLSWTSSLGDAYYNQEQGVMDAVQVMRRRAQEAGHLNSTPQQTVTTEGPDIQIEPVSPEVVYVPAYDPWIVYGDPLVAWPGWYPYPGVWYDGPSLFSALASASGSLGGTGGVGTTGVSIGITTTRFTTTRDITREAGCFITATDSIEPKARAVLTIMPKEHHSLSMGIAGRHAAIPSLVVRATSAPAPSAATAELVTAMRSPVTRAARAPGPSAASDMAERNGAFRRAEAPASAAEAVFMGAAVFTAADATERTQS